MVDAGPSRPVGAPASPTHGPTKATHEEGDEGDVSPLRPLWWWGRMTSHKGQPQRAKPHRPT
jgi:hypothetical protein